MMRRVISYFLILILTGVLSGCFFDHPLTSFPSKNINTWLLGVWEYSDQDGELFRTTVQPMEASRYAVKFQKLGKNGKATETWELVGYISRVGSSLFLNLRVDAGPKEARPGTYIFFHYQVVDQNSIILRPLQLDSSSDASSYQLRKEIRRKLKDKTLYGQTQQYWKRVSEVYWGTPFEDQPPQPLRYPTK